MDKGQTHHLEGRIVKMEAIPKLCADRKVAHKDHAKRARGAHGRALWRMNHEGGCKEKSSTSLR